MRAVRELKDNPGSLHAFRGSTYYSGSNRGRLVLILGTRRLFSTGAALLYRLPEPLRLP